MIKIWTSNKEKKMTPKDRQNLNNLSNSKLIE